MGIDDSVLKNNSVELNKKFQEALRMKPSYFISILLLRYAY